MKHTILYVNGKPLPSRLDVSDPHSSFPLFHPRAACPSIPYALASSPPPTMAYPNRFNAPGHYQDADGFRQIPEEEAITPRPFMNDSWTNRASPAHLEIGTAFEKSKGTKQPDDSYKDRPAPKPTDVTRTPGDQAERAGYVTASAAHNAETFLAYTSTADLDAAFEGLSKLQVEKIQRQNDWKLVLHHKSFLERMEVEAAKAAAKRKFDEALARIKKAEVMEEKMRVERERRLDEVAREQVESMSYDCKEGRHNCEFVDKEGFRSHLRCMICGGEWEVEGRFRYF